MLLIWQFDRFSTSWPWWLVELILVIAEGRVLDEFRCQKMGKQETRCREDSVVGRRWKCDPMSWRHSINGAPLKNDRDSTDEMIEGKGNLLEYWISTEGVKVYLPMTPSDIFVLVEHAMGALFQTGVAVDGRWLWKTISVSFRNPFTRLISVTFCHQYIFSTSAHTQYVSTYSVLY